MIVPFSFLFLVEDSFDWNEAMPNAGGKMYKVEPNGTLLNMTGCHIFMTTTHQPKE
jgi:hypothetical protein